LKIKQDNGNLTIRDSSRNIDCIYDGTKLSGVGSRAKKEEIMAEIVNFNMSESIKEVSDVSSNGTDDYREIASLSAFINSFSSENVRTTTVTLEDIKKWESNPIKYAYQLYT